MAMLTRAEKQRIRRDAVILHEAEQDRQVEVDTRPYRILAALVESTPHTRFRRAVIPNPSARQLQKRCNQTPKPTKTRSLSGI